MSSTPEPVVRREVRINIAERGPVSGVVMYPDAGAQIGVVLGHGAGGTLHNTVVAGVAHGLSAGGYATLRYNFPFAEAGRRRPDFPRLLQATTIAAADWLREHLAVRTVVLGGKSLGGRMSTHVAADHAYDAAALVLFGYPLHPPRRTDELRDAHLPRVGVPMLFVEGTRDPYANLEILDAVLERVRLQGGRADLHVIDGADHDFRLPVRMRRSHAEVRDEIVAVTRTWIQDVVAPLARTT